LSRPSRRSSAAAHPGEAPPPPVALFFPASWRPSRHRSVSSSRALPAGLGHIFLSFTAIMKSVQHLKFAKKPKSLKI
jgi:hypothetical protein